MQDTFLEDFYRRFIYDRTPEDAKRLKKLLAQFPDHEAGWLANLSSGHEGLECPQGQAPCRELISCAMLCRTRVSLAETLLERADHLLAADGGRIARVC